MPARSSAHDARARLVRVVDHVRRAHSTTIMAERPTRRPAARRARRRRTRRPRGAARPGPSCAAAPGRRAAARTPRRPRAVVGVTDHHAGHAVDHRVLGTPGVAGDLGTPHAAASRKTMPKPSCSRPPHRLRHSIVYTSAQPYRAGSSSLATRPRNRTGASSSVDERFAAAARRARHRRSPAAGRARSAQARRGADRRVEPLARHETADADDQLGVGRQPEARPRGAHARRRSSGRNRSVSTPGGTTVIGRVRPAARSASRAG